MKIIKLNSNKHLQNQPRRSWETVEYTDNPELPDLKDIEIVEDFLPPPEMLVKRSDSQQSQPLQYGKYSGGYMSTWEDFSVAEWRLSEEERSLQPCNLGNYDDTYQNSEIRTPHKN